jgi:hypothetical protein
MRDELRTEGLDRMLEVGEGAKLSGHSKGEC